MKWLKQKLDEWLNKLISAFSISHKKYKAVPIIAEEKLAKPGPNKQKNLN